MLGAQFLVHVAASVERARRIAHSGHNSGCACFPPLRGLGRGPCALCEASPPPWDESLRLGESEPVSCCPSLHNIHPRQQSTCHCASLPLRANRVVAGRQPGWRSASGASEAGSADGASARPCQPLVRQLGNDHARRTATQSSISSTGTATRRHLSPSTPSPAFAYARPRQASSLSQPGTVNQTG